MLRSLARKAIVVVAAALASVSGAACSQADDGSDSAEAAAVDAKACPNGLIDLVARRDEESHLFTPSVAGVCLSTNVNGIAPAELEPYLSKHPFVTLDKKADFLSGCVQRYEGSTGRKLGAEQRAAVVGNYYFLMNTLKQGALADLEAMAGIDMLLGREPLPESEGPYEHPFLHESGDWQRRLREHCDVDPSSAEAVVALTNAVLWQLRKIDATLEAAGPELAHCSPQTACKDLEKRVEALNASHDALLKSAAPWLVGKEMKGLLAPKLDLKAMVDAENAYELVDESGVIQPKVAWKPGAGNPLLAQEAEVRAALPKQLRATRAVLAKRFRDAAKAADFLHLRQESRFDASDFQAVMKDIAPFDPQVFSQFYASDAYVNDNVWGALDRIEVEVRALLGAKLPSIASSKWPSATDLGQRLLRLEVALAELQSAGVDVRAQTQGVADIRANYTDAVKGISASSALIAAKCRNEARTSVGAAAEAVDDLAIGAAITVGTAGLGSWLAAARAAVSAGQAAQVGLEWASAARVSTLAARGAQGLARSAVSYEKQARILWGVLLASNPYFIGDAVVASIQSCNALIDENMLRLFDVPFDLSEVQCLEGKNAMSRQAVASYKACAVGAVVNVALNTIATFGAAREMRHGPLGPAK